MQNKEIHKSQEFWSIPTTELLQQLQATPQGLSAKEAHLRLKRYGPNLLKIKKKATWLTLLLSQFKSPIILILIFAALLSWFLHQQTEAFIILVIIFASGLLGFWQEWNAADAVKKLLATIETRATVLRDEKAEEISVEKIIPGDIILLKAGDIIPADSLILESKDTFIEEAALTGETYPVEKATGVLKAETPLSQRTNVLFMGTHVVSGTAKAVVVNTGKGAEFGKVFERLQLRPPETAFQYGIRRFGYFLLEVTLMLVIVIFAINVYFAHPILEALLFSLALAVGMVPHLLPAIVNINMAYGAKRMALENVIVKRLDSIENFGSMNIFCSDKTGTLTEGVVDVHSALDVEGKESKKVLLYAYLNAFYETGFINPIDEAICKHYKFDISEYKKLDEVPYDFTRRRLSILVSKDKTHLMVTKGALSSVLSVCSHAETTRETILDIAAVKQEIQERFEDLSRKGFRVLGIAYRNVEPALHINKNHEANMTFLGFLVLFDPPKSRIVETLGSLKKLGVSLKIITGDNRFVTANLGQQVGFSNSRIITGIDLNHMSDEALLKQVNEVEIFAEVEPNQKERIILALKKTGNVVGFMGDGINDASALHASDVGISVDSAVDVAKESADIVLLKKDLSVLVRGIEEGRKTFANTLKYIFMATSANFGNMFSMAGASLFMPFLPLLPKQILLLNFLTDFPELTIATDKVDPELIDRPRRWDIGFIRKFMLVFGPLSSVFDFLAFGVFLFIFHAEPELFRTGWFMLSILSAVLIVLVIRTRRPFFKSMPGKPLLLATLLVIAVAFSLPYTPLGDFFELRPLPVSYLLAIGLIALLYVFSAELMKKIFYRIVKF